MTDTEETLKELEQLIKIAEKEGLTPAEYLKKEAAKLISK